MSSLENQPLNQSLRSEPAPVSLRGSVGAALPLAVEMLRIERQLRVAAVPTPAMLAMERNEVRLQQDVLPTTPDPVLNKMRSHVPIRQPRPQSGAKIGKRAQF